MKAPELIEALQIIESARPQSKSSYHVRAEHDTVWAGGADYALTEDQRFRLQELGVSWNDDVDGWEMRL